MDWLGFATQGLGVVGGIVDQAWYTQQEQQQHAVQLAQVGAVNQQTEAQLQIAQQQAQLAGRALMAQEAQGARTQQMILIGAGAAVAITVLVLVLR